MTEQQTRLRLFLAELAVLREEYGMEIEGCGECGSPAVRDVGTLLDEPDQSDDGQVGRFLAWNGERYVFRQGSIGEDG